MWLPSNPVIIDRVQIFGTGSRWNSILFSPVKNIFCIIWIYRFSSTKGHLIRVWTQFCQHLIAKMWSMDKKLRFSFLYRVVSRRMSFIRQKNRSTRFRIAYDLPLFSGPLTCPQDHDREAATVQGLTHLIAKVLQRMGPVPSRMTTRSFDLLVEAVSMVQDDASEVFDAIEKSNPYSADIRRRFFDLAHELSIELENNV